MKLRIKQKPNLVEGQIRIVAGFLWLPKYINYEWRWLECASWTQIVIRVYPLRPVGGVYSPGQTYLKWESREWIHKRKEKVA